MGHGMVTHTRTRQYPCQQPVQVAKPMQKPRGDTEEGEEPSPKTKCFLWCWLFEDEYSPTRSDEGTWAEEHFQLKFQDLHISDEEDNEEGRLYDELIRAIKAAHTDPGPSTS
jgi:hypothetical protein